jgi:hypothetical protein
MVEKPDEQANLAAKLQAKEARKAARRAAKLREKEAREAAEIQVKEAQDAANQASRLPHGSAGKSRSCCSRTWCTARRT